MTTQPSILTEKQKKVCLLRRQGMTYQEIAKELNTGTDAARRCYLKAQRQLREYEAYHDPRFKNDQPVELPLTRGELAMIVEGLKLLELEIVKRHKRYKETSLWENLPYGARILDELYIRAYKAVYEQSEPDSIFD